MWINWALTTCQLPGTCFKPVLPRTLIDLLGPALSWQGLGRGTELAQAYPQVGTISSRRRSRSCFRDEAPGSRRLCLWARAPLSKVSLSSRAQLVHQMLIGRLGRGWDPCWTRRAVAQLSGCCGHRQADWLVSVPEKLWRSGAAGRVPWPQLRSAQ